MGETIQLAASRRRIVDTALAARAHETEVGAYLDRLNERLFTNLDYAIIGTKGR